MTDMCEYIVYYMDKTSLLGREVDLNSLMSRQDESILGDVEVRIVVGAVQDLDQGRSLRRKIRNVVDIPLSLARCL